MTDEANGGAYYVEYKPSLAERVWRNLGFHFHLGEDVADDVPWTGWMQTRSTMHFGWVDRLRLLVTGRLEMQHTFHLDTPSPDKIHTRFDWEIAHPGKRDR